MNNVNQQYWRKWKYQHQVLLFRSRIEWFPDTQWTLKSQREELQKSSSNDLKTFLLSHALCFLRHLYFIAIDGLKWCIYDFPQIRDASLFLLFALKDTWETEFACHSLQFLGWLSLHFKALHCLFCVQFLSSPHHSCLCDICAQPSSPQYCQWHQELSNTLLFKEAAQLLLVLPQIVFSFKIWLLLGKEFGYRVTEDILRF